MTNEAHSKIWAFMITANCGRLLQISKQAKIRKAPGHYSAFL